MSDKLTIKLATIGFLALMLILFSGKLVEDVDAGEIVIIQDMLDGELHVVKEPGPTAQFFGKVTHYKRENQYWFLLNEDKTRGSAIDVKWNDGGHALVSGSIRYTLPSDDASLIKLHSNFGSQENMEASLIKPNIEKAVFMTGPLMSSKESYAEKRNDLIFYFEDQASNGVYKTKEKSDKELDPLSGEEKTVTKVEILTEKDGVTPKRQEKSPILDYKIKLYNTSVKEILYSESVEKQIQVQQQAIMNVQTAIANAKKAEQDAITIAKQGEADAAKAKWQQEVIKAKLVTEAESRRKVAELDVQTAELQKQKAIKEGEGEAAKRKLIMNADGALDKKLEAWIKSQQYWADAFAKHPNSLVPQIMWSGPSGYSNNNAAVNFMDLMTIKASRDLSLDLKNK